jgi:dGTPase
MLLSRENIEDREIRNIAPYGVKSINSKGRLFPQVKDKYRTEYQRDRDRIIHSKAFRRLKHKTQVFVASKGDHYRNRLSHTLEVAQSSRQLARTLNVNEDLTECIALAHDLGHTPFGHIGEYKLNSLMKDHNGFEHNFQSKRILEKLETKYSEYPGLNLTFEVLDGLMKHNAPYEFIDNSDLAIFYPSIEAQIVNICDEIAYVTHDIDDGLSAGILKHIDLVKNIPLWFSINKNNPELDMDKKRFMNVRSLINILINDVLITTENNLDKFKIMSYEDVKECKFKLVDFSTTVNEQVVVFREYLLKNFYRNEQVHAKSLYGEKIITYLFNEYTNNINLLVDNELNLIKNGAAIPRVIADYISGMTDNFAIDTYNKMTKKD